MPADKAECTSCRWDNALWAGGIDPGDVELGDQSETADACAGGRPDQSQPLEKLKRQLLVTCPAVIVYEDECVAAVG